ncbi:MAG: DUF1501 domain-containing protein [Pirellulaceae bacterium]|nr:DUF1501 domain-containing protein [Pirellulaceae bacterium]
MLRINAGGRSGRYCDGLSRRSFVQVGVAGMASVGLADVLRATDRSSSGSSRSAILLWLDGGPSHMDLYDLKPDSPAEYRGIWSPISTNVPGMDIGELFPRQAKVADKFSIVRSLHHDTGDHFAGGHRMLTAKNMGVSGANNAGKFPSIGAVLTRTLGPTKRGMPSYVSVPVASSIGLRPGYFGGNWMGGQYDPFQTGGDPNNKNFQVQNLNLPKDMTVDRLADRRALVRSLDQISRNIDHSGEFLTRDRFDEDAFEFVAGDRARRAFDIGSEDDKIRDMYGRHTWGQSTLLARRLVEAGSRFVTVHFGGWDHHWNLKSGMESHLPRVDSAVAGLFTDLDQRGMLDSTIVMWSGEFGRSPVSQNGTGRDHNRNAFSLLLAGGGFRKGHVHGATDDVGYRSVEDRVSVNDLHATLLHQLGLDHDRLTYHHHGRDESPTDSVVTDARVVRKLLA